MARKPNLPQLPPFPPLPRLSGDGARGVFNSVFSWMLRQRFGQIEHFMRHPLETQEELFGYLIGKGRRTAWGKQHGYGALKPGFDGLERFKDQVPISDYSDLQPWIERIMAGEQQILWPSEITWFAKSSGTTSAKSKFIPVSKESMDDCHFKAGRDLMAIYCLRYPNTQVFSGRGLVMGGSHQVNKLNESSYFGDVSAVMMQNMPMAARFIRTPDLSIALMDDWEEKIQAMAETTIKQNVTHMAGVPTWTLVLIERIFELTGADNLREVWPNLELYIHGGVSFQPYRDRFAELIRPLAGEKNGATKGAGSAAGSGLTAGETASQPMRYLETYNASEGFFGIQDKLDREDMLLMLDYGIFYEFIPFAHLEDANPPTVGLDELEVGKIYAPVISTNAGLWRYRIGDTIRVTDDAPFRVQVAGRIKHFINAFGEEVIVDNADAAIRAACKATGAHVREYTAAPVYFEAGQKGAHEWLIEFEQPPRENAGGMGGFVEALDQGLQAVNTDYAAKRFKDMALRLPTVHALPEGSFHQWLKARGKLGGQHKVPRLSNGRELVEKLKAQAGLGG